MCEKCDGAFLEEVRNRWEYEHLIDAYTFPRLLELVKKSGYLEAENNNLASIILKVEADNKLLKTAITAFGDNPAGFDWAVLDRIEKLKEGLRSVCRSTEIMEARRLARQILKGEQNAS